MTVEVWSFDNWDGNWYDYQGAENSFMLSSVMPDKKRQEHEFRDHLFTTRTIDALEKLVKEPKYFMLNIGFKNPHLALHVPHRFYEMYKNKTESWRLTKKELRFPFLASGGGYKCCAEGEFHYMNNEGASRHKESISLGDINQAIPLRMRDELMMGYCGMITYTDTQLGRILDAVDKLNLWNNLTIVLTADHGMHNGEKGLWYDHKCLNYCYKPYCNYSILLFNFREKWSLFDESSRVPLMIYHPQSPFKGQHYTKPVELIDVFPTINDLTQAPYDPKSLCKGGVECDPLQGKSLAPVVLGDVWSKHLAKSVLKNDLNKTIDSIKLVRDFSITQVWRCVNQEQYIAAKKLIVTGVKTRPKIWNECERDALAKGDISLMGYSMRTNDYRYTAWVRMDHAKMQPFWDLPPLEEDLFDHRNETLADFTHQETSNIAKRSGNDKVVSALREKLLTFLKTEVKYRGKF